MARRNVTALKDTWWMHTHARVSPLSLKKKYIFHTTSSRQNAAMQQIFTTCSPRVWQHGNPGAGHSAGGKHWTMHGTHHNTPSEMTAWKSILIGQHVAPSTPTAPLRAGSSTAPDDPIMSFFLLVPLLMSHQGKHFPARRMQESGSCTARRLPLEDSLLSSHGRKEECSSAMCMSASTRIYWGITCITSKDWTNLIFVCRGDRVLCCSSSIWESIQTVYCHCSRPAVPGLLSLLLGTAGDCFSKSSDREAKLHIPKWSVTYNSSSSFPPWEAELPTTSMWKASTDDPAWSSKLCTPPALESCPASHVGLPGKEGRSTPVFDALQCSTRCAGERHNCSLHHPLHQDRLFVLIQGIAPEKVHFGNGHNKNPLGFDLSMTLIFLTISCCLSSRVKHQLKLVAELTAEAQGWTWKKLV